MNGYPSPYGCALLAPTPCASVTACNRRNVGAPLPSVWGCRQGWAGPKKLTRVAAPSPTASLERRTVCGRTEQRRPPVSKRYETKVRMVWGSFLIAIVAAALKTPTRNGYNAQGVNLTFCKRLGPTASGGSSARREANLRGFTPT